MNDDNNNNKRELEIGDNLGCVIVVIVICVTAIMLFS